MGGIISLPLQRSRTKGIARSRVFAVVLAAGSTVVPMVLLLGVFRPGGAAPDGMETTSPTMNRGNLQHSEGQAADSAVVDSRSGKHAELLVEEDFSTYRNTEELLANPRKVYLTREDKGTKRIVLDTTLGYGSSGKSMRYDFPAMGCGNHTITRGIPVPGHRREIWLEVVARFSPNFSTRMPESLNCKFAPEYKFVFGLLEGESGRFDLMAGTFGHRWDAAYPGAREKYKIRGPFGNGFDGQWHVYRFHWKLSSTPDSRDGIYRLWMDGRLVVNDAGINVRPRRGKPAQRFWLIALGRNINNGPAHEQSVWWGRVRLWGSDPGWF